MGETSYILIIPVVFGWWHRERVCVCVFDGGAPPLLPLPKGEPGLRSRVGGLPCKAPPSYPGLSSAGGGPELPGVYTFPFNYSVTRTRICSPRGSWVTLGLNS